MHKFLLPKEFAKKNNEKNIYNTTYGIKNTINKKKPF